MAASDAQATEAGGHATFITHEWTTGFIARCICGWRNTSSGYDYDEALMVCSTHASEHLTADDVRALAAARGDQ